MRNLLVSLLILATPCLLEAQGVAGSGRTIRVSKPDGSIQRAADTAQPGDHILVHAGIYKEQVTLPRGGTSESTRIIYSAAPGEKVIIQGSPQTTAAFTADHAISYITIEGFVIKDIETAPAAMDGDQPGAISTGGGTHWIIRHNTFTNIRNVAISIGQKGHPYPKSPWNQPAYSDLTTDLAAVGHHEISDNHISHCGQGAIYGLLHGSASIIENNTMEAIGGPAIRLAVTVDAIIRNNTIKSDTGIFLGPIYQGARITGNTIKATREGIRLYDSHGPLLVDHNTITGNLGMIAAEANIFVKNIFHDCSITNDTLPIRSWATSNYLRHSLVIKQTIPALPLEDQWYGNRFDGLPAVPCPRIDAAAIGIIPLSAESIEAPDGSPLTVVADGPPLTADTAYTEWPLTHLSPAVHPQPFVHPGLLHTRADLDRIEESVARGLQPWKSGFAVFAADPASSADYVPHPAAHVERSLLLGKGQHIGNLEKDGNAAYQNALMWYITGDSAHARKAIEILDAWSSTLQVFDGTDIELGAGINGFKFANAAELMRYTYPAWPEDHIHRCQEMLLNIFYPPLQYFALWAHGNWDLCCMKSMIAIGVFCDNHALFDRAVDYFYRGNGNGSIMHYIVNGYGQVQESGRDQGHTELGIGQMAEICQVAWSQGLDLYGADSSRLLLGFEYVAKYNLGEEVPFVPYTDQSHRFPASHISTNGRGPLRAIYEMALNHYEHAGIPADRLKYTRMAAEKLRPEGAGFGADHPGFGTLLFSLSP